MIGISESLLKCRGRHKEYMGDPRRRPGEEILERSSRLIFISKLPSSTRAVGVIAFDESALLSKPI